MRCDPCSINLLELATELASCLESSAIQLAEDQQGIPIKIYYPQNVGHYTGRHDDIEYKDEPDEITRALIPSLFDMSFSPLAGVNDNLFNDEFIWHCSKDKIVPHLSKVVAISEKLGNISFLVDEQSSMNMFYDTLWKEVKLVPFMRYSRDDFGQNDVDDQLNDLYEDSRNNMNEFNDDLKEDQSIPTNNSLTYNFKKLS